LALCGQPVAQFHDQLFVALLGRDLPLDALVSCQGLFELRRGLARVGARGQSLGQGRVSDDQVAASPCSAYPHGPTPPEGSSITDRKKFSRWSEPGIFRAMFGTFPAGYAGDR
jgi:hypothetical protein